MNPSQKLPITLQRIFAAACLTVVVPLARAQLTAPDAATLASELKGETVPLGEHVLSYTRREPIGVVGGIVPWKARSRSVFLASVGFAVTTTAATPVSAVA